MCLCLGHTSVCVSVCCGASQTEMAAPGVILSPFPKEKGEICHACYPSRHWFLGWNIGKKGERWKCSKKRRRNDSLNSLHKQVCLQRISKSLCSNWFRHKSYLVHAATSQSMLQKKRVQNKRNKLETREDAAEKVWILAAEKPTSCTMKV